MKKNAAKDSRIHSDERYKAFIAQSTEGIWRFELEKPLSISSSITKQLNHFYKYAYLAECNDAMAQMYGLKKASDIIGARLGDLLIRSDAKNTVYLTDFIKSGYKLTDRESFELDAKGKLRVFRNNLIGIIENGYALRAWGLQRDVTKQKQEEERQALLEKVSNKLVGSLNHNITIKEIARLIVPDMADYCRIAIIDGDGSIKEIAVNHKDPSKVTLAVDLYNAYKDSKKTAYGLPTILRTGKSEIMELIDDTLLKKFKAEKKTVAIIKQLGLKSYMGVPLIARKKVIGAMTFSSVKEYRYYTKQDLQFAEEIARRIALTLDNIRLFKEAQDELKMREQIANNLQAEKDRLQLAQEAGQLGVFEWDMKKELVTWTPQLEMIYGLQPGTFKRTYKHFLSLVHPDDRQRIEKEYKKQTKDGNTTEFEFRVILPDKSIRWIYSKAQVFTDKHKKPIRTVGINIDITERMQARINLEFLATAGKILGSSLDYQTTLNQVAKLAVPKIADWFAIDILDEKGVIQPIAVSHKDPQKIKWAKEVRKKYPPDLNAPQGLGQVLRSGKSELYPSITEEMLKRSAKDKKHLKFLKDIGLCSIMIVPLFSEGKPMGAITCISSETKRQYTQADLAIAEELAQRASLAIENARLYRNAQAAISLRDDFISVASHELKTPITSVKIFTQVLQKHAEKIEDQQAAQSLAKMDKQIDKLTELIYNLLNIAKIQSGRMEFSRKEFSFDMMVTEIVDVLQQMTVQHQIVIIGKTDKKVYGDEDRIGQVLSNLISNAIKYSPSADKIIITLAAKKNHIAVSVQDFGIGMDKQHLNKIFNRFYRVAGKTDRTFPGLGIGLYISHEIIDRHGGKLWAESIPGKGSIFYMTLPLRRIPREETLPQSRLQN